MATGPGLTANSTMRARLARLLLIPLTIGVMSFSFVQTAYAAYGTGAYGGACTYQTQECPGGAGAPDTGQQAVSLLWPAIAGFIGFLLVSFVTIRYFNRNRDSQT